MGKRFVIVIGVAAAGVMALGAQPAAGHPKYDTKLSMNADGGGVFGLVESQLGKCERRRVVLFKQRPGADLRLARTRSEAHAGDRGHTIGVPRGYWDGGTAVSKGFSPASFRPAMSCTPR